MRTMCVEDAQLESYKIVVNFKLEGKNGIKTISNQKKSKVNIH